MLQSSLFIDFSFVPYNNNSCRKEGFAVVTRSTKKKHTHTQHKFQYKIAKAFNRIVIINERRQSI